MDDSPNRSLIQKMVFPGRFESLSRISRFVVGAAGAAGLDKEAVYAVEMAVDEACTNIIQHAYGGEGRGDIACTCQINQDKLTIVLQDYGSPFEPSKVPEPNVNAALEDREEGGLGLYLIRKLMDEVHFEFTPDSGNVLTMVKHKETIS